MKKQTTINQKGEIEFRKKLIRQQINEENIFDDEFGSEGIKNLLESWMEYTYKDMKGLKNAVISPFLEIGAERCQRSLVLENDIGAKGAAIDISFDMLKTCDNYSRIFKKKKIPLRICCDAYNLPFAKNSVPFVFCYHTLHHFPDPDPILHEIFDVLSPGGCFFIGTEPYKKILHLNIYKSSKRYSKKALNANYAKKALDYFFSYRPCNETEHGIVENEDISLEQWRNSLSLFHDKDIEIKSLGHIKSCLFGRRGLKFFLACLFGGAVSGACYKEGRIKGVQQIERSLICPECKAKNTEEGLVKIKGGFICRKCGIKYPLIEDVAFLLLQRKFKELYPELFMKYSNKDEAEY